MTIHICGDSTAASYGPAQHPLTGWGQVIGEMLPGIGIANHAIAGRSTRTFLQEGRLAAFAGDMRPGDLLLIQFTHNDRGDKPERHTDADTTFPENLTVFVETARSRGAIPVLLTPIPERRWAQGRLLDPHGAYPPAIRRLAQATGTPLIDVLKQGMAALQAAGEADTEAWYMHLAPGQYPPWPEGLTDDVHTRRAGAEVFARIVADGLRALGLI